MLYASESAFFLDERSPPTPPPGASNSSGWPSLINIQSAVSLLSSYTPQKTTAASSQLDEIATSANAAACSMALSPINDKGHQRPRVAPMDVDFNDTDDSWLNHPIDHQLKQQQPLVSPPKTPNAKPAANCNSNSTSNPNADEHQSKSK
ncbi:hypothetical protein IWW48_006249 [Coemansia sp. RSA 1200]|nr:hypothetical protein IWW48_006249 [Coemansia sp. RSA 1200]